MLTAILVTAVLAGAQQQRSAARDSAHQPAARVDTVRLVVQPAAPVVVQAPSQLPTIALGAATLVLLGMQLVIASRQSATMNRQTTLMDRQTVLLSDQADARRVEAVGAFYRLAHDLVAEFKKATVLPTVPIPADADVHARHMVREASRIFAALGSTFVLAANAAGLRLDEYFDAVDGYNHSRGPERATRWQTVQSMRAAVGGDLDFANTRVPSELRWRYDNGREYGFKKLCSLPADLFDERETGA